ncbi:MAG: NYN domain-containing protein [Candidatus Paceibacterales bacterium]
MRIGVRESIVKFWKRWFPKKEKVKIIIDGENLYWCLRNDLGGLKITNYKEFARRLASGQKFKAIYYTSVDQTNPGKSSRFLKSLAEQGYEVRTKPLVFVGGKPKSEIDTLMAVGICHCAIDDDVDTVVIGSGDGHFADAAEYVKEEGKKVRVVSTESSLSEELRKASDEWIDLVTIIRDISRRTKTGKKVDQALLILRGGGVVTLPGLERKI